MSTPLFYILFCPFELIISFSRHFKRFFLNLPVFCTSRSSPGSVLFIVFDWLILVSSGFDIQDSGFAGQDSEFVGQDSGLDSRFKTLPYTALNS